jgi:hypothetical protein
MYLPVEVDIRISVDNKYTWKIAKVIDFGRIVMVDWKTLGN